MKIVRLVAVLVLVAFSVSLEAQTIKTADKAFEQEEYAKAAEEYEALINKEQGVDKAFTLYRIGECYRRMNSPEKAVEWYAQAEKEGYNRSELYYAYGDMLTVLGRYDEAKTYFQKYREMRPDDDRVALKLSSIEFAKAYPKTNPHFVFKPVESLNTTGSEYGIAYMNGKLVYASTGGVTSSRDNSRVSMRTGLGYSKIYIADPSEHGKFRRGVELNEFNMERANDGTFSYDHNTGIAYYTRCEPSENQCYIYYSELVDGKWKEKGRLKIDSEILQIAHPCVTPDGKRIYFSAMIEGGYGGSDIWYIEKEAGKNQWGKAINAGREVNTAGNEVFPYVINDVLFFSSDGRDGYGGLDVYASKISYGSHGKSVNLRPPFNTSYDDFNLIVSIDGKEGLLVSNRRNAERSDDIYSFESYPTVILASGYVFDKDTEAPLPGSDIVVTDSITGEKEYLKADENGYYYSFLKPNLTYTFDVSHKGYDPQSKSLETYAITFPMEFNLSSGYDMDFYLAKEAIVRTISGRVYEKETGKPLVQEPVYLYADGNRASARRTDENGVYVFENVNPDVLYKVTAEHKDYFPESKELKIVAKEGDKSQVYAKATGYDMDLALTKIVIGEEIEIEDIYYDYDKATLLPESKVELDKLIKLLNSKPGIKVQISSHTDARGADAYNSRLSEARAKSVVDYLIENGIGANQLTWKGYGETQLRIKDAKTEAEHRKNRRTTFKVLEVGETPTLDFDSFVQAEAQANPTNVGTAPSGTGNFTVRVLTASRLDLTDHKVSLAENTLKGEKVWYQRKGDGRYCYYIGRFDTREQAAAAVNQLKAAGLSDCFIDTKALEGASSAATAPSTATVQQTPPPTAKEQTDNVNFTVQISTANRLDMTDPKVKKAEAALSEKAWYEKTTGGVYRYYIGKFRDRDQAVSAVEALKAAGLSDCFVKDLKR